MSARDNRRALAFGSFARNGLIGVRMGVDADACGEGATGGESGAVGGAAAIGARVADDGGGTVGLADGGGMSG